MGQCLIQINGAGADINTEGLTATPNDVIKNKIFIGKNETDETGNIVERGNPSVVLPVNGTYDFPAGRYTGGSITQNIMDYPGRTIIPGASHTNIPTNNKYMTGNITVKGVDGLVPENIKKGAVVGGVTGTYEGYENNDPNRPYFRGTFYPGQYMNKLSGLTVQDNNVGLLNFERDHMTVSNYNNGFPVCVLSGMIDFSIYKNLEVLGTMSSTSNTSIRIYFFENLVNTYIYTSQNYDRFHLNSSLGDCYLFKTQLIASEPGVYRFENDFNIAHQGYCYFDFVVASFNIRIIRFIPK